MTYVTHCDWCGKRLQSNDDRATFDIHVERQSVPGELDRKWAKGDQAHPVLLRHVHATG